MGIEKVVNPDAPVPDFRAICPQCKGYTVFVHDLKCAVCDNKTILWCPNCAEHFKVTIE